MGELIKKNLCPECGKEVKKGSRFCNNCGAKLVDEIKTEPTEEPNTVKNEPKKLTKGIKLNIHFDKNNRYFLPIISSVVTLVVCLVCTGLICNYLVKAKTVTNTISDYSNVSITDTGLATSVKKVYDAVVVVETYAKGSLYATGTGFVFKTDDNYGYILTNNHVIENGTEIKVMFTNNDEETVTVVGSDSYSDIAVLKVAKSKVLAVAVTGNPDDMSVGDTTFAVGAPVDASTYSWTVTRGILSGKDRVVEVSSSTGSSYAMNVLQTDTAINSGNSGGPLCNDNREVIGITNMKIASSSVEGLGFAITLYTALEYDNHFLSGDTIIRPYLGVSMYDLSSNYYSSQTGIYIQSVESGSPAEKAGLQKGDVISAIDGKEVSSTAYLKYELYKHNVGDEVEITYTRNNKKNTTKVTLGSYDITT